jgi:hypothetical protein
VHYKYHSELFLLIPLLLSCATTASTPDWAQSPTAILRVYPHDAYIAQRGRGQTREAAEAAAVAEIARYFTSQINANQGFRTTTSQQNGVLSETLETETSAFVTSEINLAGLRYAQDAFYNKAERQWETVAYLDRTEAWALYEPRFKRQADSFRAGQILSPARMNAAFSGVRSDSASIPQKIDSARRNAGIYIDCPVDFESLIVNAFSRALSAEGFPVTKIRNEAAAVCAITVDEGMQKRDLGIFYFPLLQAVFTGSSGVLFTYNAAGDSASAVTPDVAKRRAYTALAEAVQKTFSAEFNANSQKQ